MMCDILSCVNQQTPIKRKEFVNMKKSNINEEKNKGVIRQTGSDKFRYTVKNKHINTVISCILSVVVTVLLISNRSVAIECVEDVDTVLTNNTTKSINVSDVVRSKKIDDSYVGTNTSVVTTITTTSTTTSTTTTSTTTTTQQIETTTENIVVAQVDDVYEEPPIVQEEYVVFKPGTHYIHRSTCRWSDSTCYEISSTDGIEARKCTECEPDMDIVTEYSEPEPVTEPVVVQTDVTYSDEGYPIGSDGLPHAALNYVTEEERIYLCNTVAQEYGCDWISQYDKALVVAVVMNRLADGGWQGSGRENTIYNILTAPYQFNPAYAVPYYRSNVTESCITAVDYYFENQSSFPHYTSFWGDGSVNHFR